MVHCLYRKERKNILEQTTPKVIKRPKVIENIEEKVIKRLEVIENIDKPKASRVIEISKAVKVDDKRRRFVNPITLNYVLRLTYSAALRNRILAPILVLGSLL